MGFFTGLFGWSQGTTTFQVPVKPYLPYNNNYVGHVLDVILDTSHPQYDPENNQVIGTIFWRNALRSGDATAGPSQFDESAEKAKTANPINRSSFKVPVPGEQVLITKAKSSRLEGPDIFLSSKYYYGEVVGMTPNNTYNGAPFIGINPERLNPFLPGARTIGELSRRFDKKIKNLEMFKDGKKAKVAKQITLNEGDFILQGRFGGSIRFAGTPISSETRGQQWAEGNTGFPGHPIMLMRVGAALPTTGKADIDRLESTLYETEDVNNDAASIYMVTTQQIPIKLAIPDKGNLAHPLATWAYEVGEAGLASDAYKKSKKAKDGEEARNDTKVVQNNTENDNVERPGEGSTETAQDNQDQQVIANQYNQFVTGEGGDQGGQTGQTQNQGGGN